MSVDVESMTLDEQLVYVCRHCKHCYERHTTPRIERDGNLSRRRRSRYVCMVHAKALSDQQRPPSISSAVPCATYSRDHGGWYPQDFEMREVDE